MAAVGGLVGGGVRSIPGQLWSSSAALANWFVAAYFAMAIFGKAYLGPWSFLVGFLLALLAVLLPTCRKWLKAVGFIAVAAAVLSWTLYYGLADENAPSRRLGAGSVFIYLVVCQAFSLRRTSRFCSESTERPAVPWAIAR